MPEKTGVKSLKETVQLPKTDFPMKGNLPENEPKMIAHWTNTRLYQKILEKNQNKPSFTMPDGPPYANSEIHIGTALNKCLKDFTIKYRNMAGFKAAFIPGWDCHGLPIEQRVSKELGAARKDKTAADMRKLCRAEAHKWIDKQRQQFVRLGILADWENPYLTMDAAYEAEEVRELARCLERGVLYRGEKPVYWCPALQTALAEAEVEYHEVTSPSIFVKFDMTEAAKKFGQFAKPVSVLIWTTTPWTLPANLAVSLHPDYTYGFYDSGSEYLMLASDLKESVEKITGIQLQQIGKTVVGKEFEGLRARHPFLPQDSIFVLGTHVTLDAGTGAVHTAPGHGQDDYQVGLRYGLPAYSPVDAQGKYTADVKEWVGVKIWDANPLVVKKLEELGRLFHFSQVKHQYPHNWRSKTPLIFRATPQWFIAMDLPEQNLRQQALNAMQDIQFFPAWGEARLRSMIENRPDWCLSRQRIWGVPIPVFFCRGCGHHLAKPEVMYRVADAMEKGNGIDTYYEQAESAFTHGHACEKCGKTEFKRGEDILDVWFDSGVCHAAVQSRRDGLQVPADIYLEGSDQHRGWFQTSLLSSLASTGKAPFRALVTHGFVNDDKGRKMSKSLGNVVDPNDISAKLGAEIVRLWAAYEDFGQDLGCGPEIFQRVTETYRRFRNTMRFILGNLNDFDPAQDLIPVHSMQPLDQWILTRLNELIRKTTDAYDQYEFYRVYHALNLFFTVDLSAGYADMLKDRLYTWKKDGSARRSAQSALYHIIDTTLRIMAPITSFLSEEVYGYLPGKKAESIFMLDFPTPNPKWDNEKLVDDIKILFELRAEASQKLEGLRREKVIGSSLDAQLLIAATPDLFAQLERMRTMLSEFFIVSQVELKKAPQTEVTPSRAEGEKCERCWYYSTDLGQNQNYPTLCAKCVQALT